MIPKVSPQIRPNTSKDRSKYVEITGLPATTLLQALETSVENLIDDVDDFRISLSRVELKGNCRNDTMIIALGINSMIYTKLVHDAIRSVNHLELAYDATLKSSMNLIGVLVKKRKNSPTTLRLASKTMDKTNKK